MGLADFLPWVQPVKEEQRDWPAISLSEAMQQVMLYAGNSYGLGAQTLSNRQEEIPEDFTGVARLAYKQNGVVFACMDVRAKLFSEARFIFRDVASNGKRGRLFGTAELTKLEQPWPGGTTGDLLAKTLQYADLSGNAYIVKRPDGVALLRPDWVSIIVGSRSDSDAGSWALDAELVGYVYHPGGYHSAYDPVALMPSEVCHFAPIPDPLFRFRGMSWLTPVLREIQADKAATLHKEKFFENGATPNMIVKFDVDSVEKMRPFMDLFREQHEGAYNAYSTLFLGAGTDATAIGHDFQQMEFKQTQGAGETRIAAAAGVPPVIVGLSEGLQAATYSNYSQARRRFADGTMRPLWRNLCGSLSNIVTVPPRAELWYDDRDIPALKEDIQDKAKEMQEKATAANQLVSAGYDPDSIVLALEAGDFSQLTHSGLVSVQLQPPGANSVSDPGQPKVVPKPSNGSAPVPTPTPA